MNELAELLNDEFELDFKGKKIQGRILNLADMIALQELFPDWDGDNVNSLVALPEEGGDSVTRVRALIEIIRLGLKCTREEAQRLCNVRNMARHMDDINRLILKILDSDDDAPLVDDSEKGKNGKNS